MCWLHTSCKGLQFDSPLLHLGGAVDGKVCVCCTHSWLVSFWIRICSLHLVILNVHSIRSTGMCWLHPSSKGLQFDSLFPQLFAAVYGKVCVCCTQYSCLFLALNLSFHLGVLNVNSIRSSGMCRLKLSSKGL